MKPIKKVNTYVKKEDDVMINSKPFHLHGNNVKDEKHNHDNHPVMFRGRPIDLNVDNSPPTYNPSTPKIRPDHANVQGNVQSTPKKSSLISVYDDGDYLVQDTDNICPFGQQSVQQRIADLQAAVIATIPDVTTLPKLLKSHNFGFKDRDNASTWYSRFNNFCLMIGIYLPPPNAMLKDSEMGKEWDSNALPCVFYSRLAYSSSPRLLSQEYSDELQLNPKPYNFLRLFMALRSNSVPDLSDRIVKRPGPMKTSQTLAQYALSWVNYFTDESNVNGIEYSKFRQYCYFVDGISGRYTSIKKFLEMEFTRSHDPKNNIPITLELRNLPTTITSLCNVHGISISQSAIHSLNNQSATPVEDCSVDHASSVKKVHFATRVGEQSIHKSKSENTKVQCWLCDGPHSFPQCDNLVRMKNICVKRPQVQKHFRQLLLKKNADGIKMILDTPDIFDDDLSTDHLQDTEDSSDVPNDMILPDETQERVNSLKILDSNTFTTIQQGINVSDVTTFSSNSPTNLQVTDEGELDVDVNDFYVLSLSDQATEPVLHETINIHPTDFTRIVQDIAFLDQ
jgi:hypothetical protein